MDYLQEKRISNPYKLTATDVENTTSVIEPRTSRLCTLV